MATTPSATAPLTVPVTAELTPMLGVACTPAPAEVIDGELPHRRYALAVTEAHGLQVEPIDEHDDLPYPYRATGTRTVADVESFLAELARRPLPTNGTLWGIAGRGSLAAVYNDHGPIDGVPGWRDDILALSLATDPDWKVWHALSGQYTSQEKFGDLIEELRHSIVAPDQADLLEIINSVRASTRGEFESTIERARGGQTLTYKKEVSARAGAVGRQLEVPSTITLALRPWEGHPHTYDVQAYFRLNVTEGQLKLAVKLFPTREIVRQAWTDLTAVVSEATGIYVYAQP